LSTSEAKKLLSQLAEVNCPVVLFSGGEPLLRNDLLELLFEAKKLGLRSVLSTNGTLIDSAAADRLAEAGVKYVGISIDGEEKFHDRFRNVKGSFKSALKGIENCSRAGVKPGLRFTITKSDCGEIAAVFDIAASAGVRRICFYHLIRTGRAKKLRDEALKPEHTRTAVDTIIEKTGAFVKKGRIDEVLTVGNHADGPYVLTRMIREKSEHYETAKKLLLANGGNKTGEKIICVGWDGNVYPDQFWRNYSLGNVKDKTFRQILQNPDEPVLNMLRNKHKFADGRCKKCKWFDLCKGNFRFSGNKSGIECWRNEPACYLRDDEIF
jgi:radical SAM protein with 4Fe4S-binding SPASM domain